jgi:intracellular septation protein A
MWGIYWRYLLSITLLLILLSVLEQSLGLRLLVTDVNLWPSIFWGIIALFFLLVTFIQAKGLAYLILGSYSQIDSKIWQQFNTFLVVFFILLAASAFIFNLLLSPQNWALYKLYVQPAALLLLPLLAANWVVFVSNKVKSSS